MATPLWTEAFRVRSYETNPNGYASMVSVCNYLQEAASNHARALGVSVEQLEESNSTWVLARLRVEVDEYPRWRDDIIVETWPSGTERLFATRDFLIRGTNVGTNGSILARATSDWLLIDRERRRPVRLPNYITSLVQGDRERALTGPVVDIPDPGPDADPGERNRAGAYEIRARYGDMDVNGHVNNVRYIEWALEAVEPDVLRSMCIVRLDVAFKAEAVFGDLVRVETAGGGPPDPVVFAHVIRRVDDGRELTRLRTVWKNGVIPRW